MSSRQHIFQEYSHIVDVLQAYFANASVNLASGETLTQFVLTSKTSDNAWVSRIVSNLVPVLLDARFQVSLDIETYDYLAKLSFRLSNTVLVCDCDHAKDRTDETNLVPSPDQVQANIALRELLSNGAQHISLADLWIALDSVARYGENVLILRNFLDKVALNGRLSASGASDVRISSFLFPEALVSFLKSCTFSKLEEELWRNAKRVVIPVFGMSELIQGDFVIVCGRGYENLLDQVLSAPVASDIESRNSSILEFRRSEGIWTQPTSWLTPDVFFVSVRNPQTAEITTTHIRNWFAANRTLLSILFLADNVDVRPNEFWVEYKGLGRTRFSIISDQYNLLTGSADAVYALYRYSFEGLSPDKLEIAQQFLSLIATDASALCNKALDIRDATKKTYERALVEKVKDYFEARQKIQDRIRGAVDATSASVVGLSREVGSDLYKIAGLILAAVIGTILDPKVTAWIGLAASLAIILYLVIVVRFHLLTMKRAQKLSKDQNIRYIKSFSEILRDDEITAFMNDGSLNEAQTLFSNRLRWATAIYAFFILVAVLVAAFLVAQLLNQGTTLPTLPTVFPSPTSPPSPLAQP